MAKYQRTTSIGDTADRDDLYNLINASNVVSISEADLVVPSTTPVAVTSMSTAPTEITNSLWWYDQTMQLLKLPVTQVGDTAASFWLSVGPDSWHYPGFNVMGATLAAGDLVRFSYSPAAGIYDITVMEPVASNVTGASMLKSNSQLQNMYGVVVTDIAPNQFGAVCSKGFCHINMNWLTYAERYSKPTSMQYSFGLIPDSGVTGGVMTTPAAIAEEKYWSLLGYGLAYPGVTSATELCPAFVTFPVGNKPTAI